MSSASRRPLAVLHVLHPPALRLAANAGARIRQPFDLKASIEGCQQQWGVTPRPMWPTVAWGGKRIETASNIVFTNGLLDPWCAAALGAQGRLAADAWVGAVQSYISGAKHRLSMTGLPVNWIPTTHIRARLRHWRYCVSRLKRSALHAMCGTERWPVGLAAPSRRRGACR